MTSKYLQWTEKRCRDNPCDICQGSASETHHIARGQHRAKAKFAEFASLILCHDCHMLKVHQGMSLAEQLAWLFHRRPQSFDLNKFWELTGRIHPTNQEVWKFVLRIRNAEDAQRTW